jgi:hypothetical protein
MPAYTDLSDNKIGDSTGDTNHFMVFCWPFSLSLLFFISNQSLSLWEIHIDSLDLEVHLDFLSFFKNIFDLKQSRTIPL